MGTQGKREVVHSRRTVLRSVSARAKKRSRVRVNELFVTVLLVIFEVFLTFSLSSHHERKGALVHHSPKVGTGVVLAFSDACERGGGKGGEGWYPSR